MQEPLPLSLGLCEQAAPALPVTTLKLPFCLVGARLLLLTVNFSVSVRPLLTVSGRVLDFNDDVAKHQGARWTGGQEEICWTFPAAVALRLPSAWPLLSASWWQLASR